MSNRSRPDPRTVGAAAPSGRADPRGPTGRRATTGWSLASTLLVVAAALVLGGAATAAGGWDELSSTLVIIAAALAALGTAVGALSLPRGVDLDLDLFLTSPPPEHKDPRP